MIDLVKNWSSYLQGDIDRVCDRRRKSLNELYCSILTKHWHDFDVVLRYRSVKNLVGYVNRFIRNTSLNVLRCFRYGFLFKYEFLTTINILDF